MPSLTSLLETFARLGYAARGFVYLSVGAIALLAALELAPRAAGGDEAFQMLAGWPFGRVWLAAVGTGLAGFAAWRALQSLFDADRQGLEPKALASRAGQALSGVVYGALSLSVFELLDEVAEAKGSTAESAAQVLALPFGQVLLIGVGLFIGGVGVAGVVRAGTEDFCRRLGCDGPTRTAATWLGRIGYAGRGIAFLPLGFFIAEAGLDADASQARSLGGALQALETQPFGSLVLASTAAGLIAFGLYAVVEARWRRIDVPG